MPFTSTSCCWRMWVKTIFRIATESLSVLLRLCRLLKPSKSSRRSTRSSTRDWEMPNSSKVCGTEGQNPLRAGGGASVAAIDSMSLTDFIGRRPWFIYRPAGLHVPPHGSVNCHVNLCRLMVFRAVAFALGALALLSAATPAEQLFHQAQKAERAGEIVRAYLLYAEAAAADPTNTDYWARAQRLRPAASLVDASPPKLPELSSDKIDRTLIGSITDEQLEQARALAPPAELDVQPGRRDYDFRGNSQALWEQLAAALHLKVLIDPEYRPTGPIRFQL